MKKKVPTILFLATLLCITIYIGVFIGRASSWNITSLPDAANYSNSAETGPLTLDLNTATAQDLLLLPGMDEQLAEEIILYREKFGNYVLLRELERIPGMTDEIYRQIKDYLTVSP